MQRRLSVRVVNAHGKWWVELRAGDDPPRLMVPCRSEEHAYWCLDVASGEFPGELDVARSEA